METAPRAGPHSGRHFHQFFYKLPIALKIGSDPPRRLLLRDVRRIRTGMVLKIPTG